MDALGFSELLIILFYKYFIVFSERFNHYFSFSISIYVNSPAFVDVFHISNNSPAKKILLDITCIHSKSPALRPLCGGHKSSLNKCIGILLIISVITYY